MNVKSHLSGSIYLVVAVLIAAAMLLNACIPIAPLIPAPPKAEMANPASVNCTDKGGQLKIEKDAQGGEVGICIFPDGSQCEEWAFTRGECKPGQKPVAPNASSTLTGVVWTWQGLVMNNDTTETPDDPATYTLEFLADGNVSIKADCNRAMGGYKVEGNKLTFGPLAATLVECQPGSLYNEYLKRLGDVQGYLIQDGKLILELKMGSGSLKFMPGATASSTANSVTGTITYWQRIALAPDAVIVVALVDVSKQNTPATVIVSQTIPAAGKQVPFPFELKYDPAKIDPKNTYAVQARITVGGELRWINTQTYNVLTRGAGTSVEVIVEQAQNAPAVSTTASSAWEETLRNGRYELPGMEVGVFQLKDGKVELRYGEGASQVYRVELIATATGDLTADGQADAVVVLAWNGGGSGTFYNLVAVGNQGGTLQQVAVEPLGDRIQVKALKIQDGKISVDMLTHGAKDPACCPTQREMRTYRLDGSALKVVS
ncbi:MAG: YbaY family lipoprotein [Chloroflexi bacterium]|nr:YbaY family lipoprotein [Chloroflexota bacterium]